MRHMGRTHGISLTLIHGEVSVAKWTKMGYISTERMAADIFTKFFPDRKQSEWSRNLSLICVGTLTSLRSYLGGAGVGYSAACERTIAESSAPGSSDRTAGAEAHLPLACVQKGVNLKSAMSVVQIPGVELLRRPISKSQGGSWRKCAEDSLGARSVWDWEGPPRLDSWGLAFCSWAGLIAKEFFQHHLVYCVASLGAPGKLSPPEVSIGEVQIGRIEPKCESRQVKLWRLSPSSLSICLVLGRARGICRLPTGIVEIPPYCWFAALSEAEHALEFVGSGV